MRRAGRALQAALPVIALNCLLAGPPARAFGPEAAAAVAARLAEPAMAPPSWDVAWVEAAVESLAARVAEPETHPESLALLRRYDAARARARLGAREPADQVTGLAPFVFASAAAALERALRDRHRGGAAAALSGLVASAVDLADPFLTTPPDPAEVEGARVWFSDLIEPSSLAALEPVGDWRGEPIVLAAALARMSAALKPAVEAGLGPRRPRDAGRPAARDLRPGPGAGAGGGDGRRRASVAGARFRPARSASAGPSESGARARHLAVPHGAGGEAWIEMFDLSGRRVRERALGVLAPGPGTLELGREELGGLPAGLYLIRLVAGGRVVTARLLRAD